MHRADGNHREEFSLQLFSSVLPFLEHLKKIKAVAKPGARLAVVEHVLGVSGPFMERAKAMMDINMMASNPSGAKERSVAEYEALFAAAGITAPATLIPMRDILSIVEVAL